MEEENVAPNLAMAMDAIEVKQEINEAVKIINFTSLY
jgi:hypothetical protein